MRIYVDLRCLQQPVFNFRGIGYHAATLLAGVRQHAPGSVRVTGILDENRPGLPDFCTSLVDDYRHAFTPESSREPSIFFQPSPMIGDQGIVGPFLKHPAILSCCAVYDFIPLEHPDWYLSRGGIRREYLSNLLWLRNYD